MGILQRLFGKEDPASSDLIHQAGESLDQERVSQMFERSPSFSIVAIPGDLSSYLPEFLSACNYQVLRTDRFAGEFGELYGELNQLNGADNSIVQKAWYFAAGHTILIEPEMVLITEVDQLSSLSAKAGAAVVAAIWERVSESVALAEFGPQGIVRQSWYCQGALTSEEINGYLELARQPDCDGLKAALSGYGLSAAALFGYVDAAVVELQE